MKVRKAFILGRFDLRLMMVACSQQERIAFPAIGKNGRSAFNIGRYEFFQIVSRGIGNDLESNPATAHPRLLRFGIKPSQKFNRANDKLLLHGTTADAAFLLSRNVTFVNLNFAMKSISSRSYQCGAKLVQHTEGGFIGLDPQLLLELLGRDARREVSDEIGCPEPCMQALLGPMKDCPSSDARLMATRRIGALHRFSSGNRIPATFSTPRADKTLCPPYLEEILRAFFRRRKHLAKVYQIGWGVRNWHANSSQQGIYMKFSPETTR